MKGGASRGSGPDAAFPPDLVTTTSQMSTLPSRDVVRRSYEVIYQTSGITDHPYFYRWILNLLQPRPGSRLLDVACGEGDLVGEARTRGVAAYGVDIAHAALWRARQSVSALPVLQGDAMNLPWRDEMFNYVTCLGSLENMADPEEAIAEIRRVLVPEGVVCIMLPNKYWLGEVLEVVWKKDEAPTFQPIERVATCRQWQAWLAAHGLNAIRVLRYNKRPRLWDHGKLKSVRKFLTRTVLNACCPFNLSWHFVFLCTKGPVSRNEDGWRYWVMRQGSPQTTA